MTAELALAADPGFIERSADPGEFIIQACERAKAWLREALDHGDIDQIVEVKSQAEAVRVYSAQKQLGKDAQFAATEIVRRAERGIGVAIRRGQEAGEIRKAGTDTRTDLADRHVANALVSPTAFAKAHELSGGGHQAGIYDLTDGVSDEDFESVIAEAKTEENLSRANVARKLAARKTGTGSEQDGEWIPDPKDRNTDAAVQRRALMRTWGARGFTSGQIADQLGLLEESVRDIARKSGIAIPADDTVRGTRRRHDSGRIARETVHALEGLAMGAELVSFADLDPAEAKEWAASLATSIRVLSRFARQMRETAQ